MGRARRFPLRGAALLAVALALGAVWAPSPALAQQVVYDPTNYAQNLLSATRALEQIRNQIRQIEQAAFMLKANPLQLSPQLSAAIGEAEGLFAAAEGIGFEIARIEDDVRALYPETWEQFDLDEVAAQSESWLKESRASLKRAMAAEALAADHLAQTKTRMEAALTSSSEAEGQTGAIQAGNQLLGVQASQLAQLQALLAAQGRALQTERMESAARAARAQEIQRRAFPSDYRSGAAPARSAF